MPDTRTRLDALLDDRANLVAERNRYRDIAYRLAEER